MPLRWIEEAEAREVLEIARWQLPAPPLAPVTIKAPWGARIRRWVVAEPACSRIEEPAVPDGAVEPRRS